MSFAPLLSPTAQLIPANCEPSPTCGRPITKKSIAAAVVRNVEGDACCTLASSLQLGGVCSTPAFFGHEPKLRAVCTVCVEEGGGYLPLYLL
jgi:hypothetical protein